MAKLDLSKTNNDEGVMDFVFIGGIVVAFALTAALAAGCARLGEKK